MHRHWRTASVVSLLAGAIIALGAFIAPGATPSSALVIDCGTADTNRDGAVDILDISSFMAPVRYINTNVGDNPPLDVRYDTVPGKSGLATDINIQDMTYVILVKNSGQCVPTSVRFLSKLTDADSQFNADPTAFTNMMNANYEGVMTFDCGICRQFGDAYTAGPAYVYQDPTKIETDCTGEQPGTDCSDILLTTGGQRCWQQFFNGSRYLADVTQADVRDEIVAHAQSLVADSAFDGMYIDVAEAYLPNAADCPGTPAVSNAAWLNAWATLVERLQNEVDGPLVVNTQYITWQDMRNVNSVDADRFFSAPDDVEIEFGWAYGRHGEGTASGAAAKLAQIDYVHGLGTGVYDQDYDDGNADFPTQLRDFGLAMYFIEWGGGDYYGTFNQDGHGSAFYPGYNKNLGFPLGPRSSCGSGCYQRQFTLGTVQANVVNKTGVVP